MENQKRGHPEAGSPSRDVAGRFDFYRSFGKRGCDILLVIAMAPIGLVVAVAAFLTALDGHNPFYRQRRVGRNGKEFWLLKLRTMVPDTEARFEDHLRRHPAARRESEGRQKLDDDPRITRLGAILRKSSLDELPQLWNVLMGHMSIVGPQLMMVHQQPLYPGRAYYRLRPGITGNWQISGRNEYSLAERAVLDDEYEAKLGFVTDMGILLRTVGAVLPCTGH